MNIDTSDGILGLLVLVADIWAMIAIFESGA